MRSTYIAVKIFYVICLSWLRCLAGCLPENGLIGLYGKYPGIFLQSFEKELVRLRVKPKGSAAIGEAFARMCYMRSEIQRAQALAVQALVFDPL